MPYSVIQHVSVASTHLPIQPVLISSAAQEGDFLNQRSHFLNNNTVPSSLFDLSEALEKMKGVYEQNPQMGDPSSLEPQITETAHNLGRLRGELAKYEVITLHANTAHDSGISLQRTDLLLVCNRRGWRKQ